MEHRDGLDILARYDARKLVFVSKLFWAVAGYYYLYSIVGCRLDRVRVRLSHLTRRFSHSAFAFCISHFSTHAQLHPPFEQHATPVFEK